MRRILPVVPLTFFWLLLAGSARAATPEEFSAYWHDGRAEIDGYTLQIERYGQIRRGQAVMIFVTEPFRKSTRVKADDTSKRPEDIVDVLKLNLVRDFQTGIYDYDTMTSLFCRSSDFHALKRSFSSQEWCGNVYSESRVDEDSVRTLVRSYFEGESGLHARERVEGGILEEELFVRLRGLRSDFLDEGQERTVPVLLSALVERLGHRPPEWLETTIRREPDERIEVPAGPFDCMVYMLSLSDGREGRFDIERAWPHRIVRWSLGPDVEGSLSGSMRVAYWKRNHEGDEELLQKLGLAPPVTATPR